MKKYMYVYPIEKFGMDAEDKTILRAWREGEVKRYTPEEFAELINNEFFCDMVYWVRVIDEDESYFEISLLHRDDLAHLGYDTSHVDDSVMKKLASRLGDDYCEQLFWSSLPVIADILGVPRKGCGE